jgi:hypothetical protein
MPRRGENYTKNVGPHRTALAIHDLIVANRQGLKRLRDWRFEDHLGL